MEASYVDFTSLCCTIGRRDTPIAGEARLDITYNSGVATQVNLIGSQSSIVFNNNDGSSRARVSASPNTMRYTNGSSSMLIIDSIAAGYSYISYGAWAGRTLFDPPSPSSGSKNSFRVGSLASPNSLPTNGSATYVGTSTGYFSIDDNRVQAVTADIVLVVDYGTRSITYQARNSQEASAIAALDISGSLGFNSGSSDFFGTLTGTEAFFGLLTGSATGSFYGPSGQELSGTFVLSVPNRLSQYVVSFGAKRQ